MTHQATHRCTPTTVRAVQWFEREHQERLRQRYPGPGVCEEPDPLTGVQFSTANRQWPGDPPSAVLRTPERTFVIMDGDWVVTLPDGFRYPMGDAHFLREFEPITTAQPPEGRALIATCYSPGPAFRQIQHHEAVAFADNDGVVAVTGQAGDHQAKAFARLFAA